MSTIRLEEQLKQAAATSEEEEQRSNEEVDRLSKETKRLREEIDQIEAQSKRHKMDAAEANRLKLSLKFDALCLALRRNDSSITELPHDSAMPKGYARPLGNALRSNAHVAALTLCLKTCLPNKIRDDGADVGDEEDDDQPFSENDIKKFCRPLVLFLSKSQVLSRLSFTGAHHDSLFNKTLLDHLLWACLQNANIVHLDLTSIAVPASILQSCFRSSSLKSMKLDFTSCCYYNVNERDAVRDSFTTFSSLTKLNMVIDDVGLAISILTGLQRASCPLEEIELDCHGMDVTQTFWLVLTTFLHSAKRLEHLLLGGLDFNGASMQDIVDVLKGRVNCVPLAKLAFDSCHFLDGAAQALRDLMQSVVEPTDRTIALREFIVDSTRGDVSNSLSAGMLVSMIVLPKVDENQVLVGGECVQSPTIGSQIQSLTVDPVSCCPDFLGRLARQELQINLSELIVTQLRYSHDAVALAQCISKIRSLRSLKVSYVNTSVRPIVSSLRTNGHVQAISFELSPYSRISIEKECRLAQAYCERNQFLDDLLYKATNFEPRPSEGESSENCDILLYPALAQAAMQIPDTRPATLLRTLLCLQDAVGVA